MWLILSRNRLSGKQEAEDKRKDQSGPQLAGSPDELPHWVREQQSRPSTNRGVSRGGVRFPLLKHLLSQSASQLRWYERRTRPTAPIIQKKQEKEATFLKNKKQKKERESSKLGFWVLLASVCCAVMNKLLFAAPSCH